MRVKRTVLCLAVLGALGLGVAGAQPAAVDPSTVLAWIPYVRVTPEYDNVVKVLGFRPVETKTTDPAELERLLTGKSVLLIPEQPEAETASLETMGKATGSVLRGFLARRGRIVGMTHAKGAEDILRGAGIWSCDDDYDMKDVDLAVAVAGHALVAGVPATFKGPDGSTDFAGVPSDAVIVVWDPRDRAPVVFQWSAHGGSIIMIGFDYFSFNDATAGILRSAVPPSLPSLSPCPACPSCPACPPVTAVWTSVSVSDVERALSELGLAFERKTDKAGDPYWSFRTEGITVGLFVDDQTAKLSGAYQYLVLYAGWSTGGKGSCTEMNSWNLQKRGSRAYLDRDNDPGIEADLYLRGGVTWDAIKQFIERFRISVKAFETHIGAKK